MEHECKEKKSSQYLGSYQQLMLALFNSLLYNPTFEVQHQRLPFSEPLDATLNTMTMTGVTEITDPQCFEGHTEAHQQRADVLNGRQKKQVSKQRFDNS